MPFLVVRHLRHRTLRGLLCLLSLVILCPVGAAPIPVQAQAQTANPTLDDLFAGKARFPDLSKSVEVTFPSFVAEQIPVVDQKLAFFENPSEPGVQYAATRGFVGDGVYNIFLVKSTDGVTFTQLSGTGPTGIFNFPAGGGWTVYDPSIAADTSTTPWTYVMTTECAKTLNTLPYDGFGASLCTSVSTTPWDASSWSFPRLIVENQGFKSTSTGVALIDAGNIYLKWTVLDDGNVFSTTVDEGTESASTWAAKVSDYSTYKGYSPTLGQLLIGASQNTTCSSAWDCNIVDVQDWQHIGNYYYVTYNGANYFRCSSRTAPLTNHWALAIRRSSTPLGSYAESTGPIIAAERNDICGISYPVLSIQTDRDANGHIIAAPPGKYPTYLYYAYYPTGGGNKIMRSQLTWDTAGTAASNVAAPTTPQFSADFKPGELTIRPNTSVQLAGAFLKMQTDGNLVMYAGTPNAQGALLWNTGASDKCAGVPCYAVFQADGNFVLYAQNTSTPYWSAAVAGQALKLRSAAPFVALLDATGKTAWTIDSLQPGQTLTQPLLSPNGAYSLQMQADGNLVENRRADNVVMWAAYTAGQKLHAGFQPDGNLVVNDAANKNYWNSGTSGKPGAGAQLVLRNDGTLVITDASGAVYWPASALLPNQTLARGQAFTSPNGAYALQMQADGNLVESRKSDNLVVWSAYTTGAATHVSLQSDGNLVVNDDTNKNYWNSETGGKPGAGAKLDLRNDGTLVLTDASGTVYWPGPSSLLPNQTLARGQSLTSPNGAYLLLMQRDGNLAKYRKSDNLLLWSTGTPTSATHAAFQTDGSLVVNDDANTTSWTSGTSGKPGAGARLELRNDGKLVITDGGGTEYWTK